MPQFRNAESLRLCIGACVERLNSQRQFGNCDRSRTKAQYAPGAIITISQERLAPRQDRLTSTFGQEGLNARSKPLGHKQFRLNAIPFRAYHIFCQCAQEGRGGRVVVLQPSNVSPQSRAASFVPGMPAHVIARLGHEIFDMISSAPCLTCFLNGRRARR
jgi:hypothetical protein